MIGYYFRCIKWLWKNRDWQNTRQKWKAMEKYAAQGSEGE